MCKQAYVLDKIRTVPINVKISIGNKLVKKIESSGTANESDLSWAKAFVGHMEETGETDSFIRSEMTNLIMKYNLVI